MFKLYEKALKQGSDKVITIMLYKLNMLGGLVTGYRDIMVNTILLKKFHIESFYMNLKRMVILINDMFENRKELSTVTNLLNKTHSWKVLKEFM